jgi:hypothetical protein
MLSAYDGGSTRKASERFFFCEQALDLDTYCSWIGNSKYQVNFRLTVQRPRQHLIGKTLPSHHGYFTGVTMRQSGTLHYRGPDQPLTDTCGAIVAFLRFS